MDRKFDHERKEEKKEQNCFLNLGLEVLYFFQVHVTASSLSILQWLAFESSTNANGGSNAKGSSFVR